MLEQIQLDGNAARVEVMKAWPEASSAYIGATAAEVYDRDTGAVLGRAQASEFVVEHAWVAAARATREPASRLLLRGGISQS